MHRAFRARDVFGLRQRMTVLVSRPTFYDNAFGHNQAACDKLPVTSGKPADFLDALMFPLVYWSVVFADPGGMDLKAIQLIVRGSWCAASSIFGCRSKGRVSWPMVCRMIAGPKVNSGQSMTGHFLLCTTGTQFASILFLRKPTRKDEVWSSIFEFLILLMISL